MKTMLVSDRDHPSSLKIDMLNHTHFRLRDWAQNQEMRHPGLIMKPDSPVTTRPLTKDVADQAGLKFWDPKALFG